MPKGLKLIRRGERYYVRGTIKVGERTKSIYTSTGLFDEGKAQIFATKLEAQIIEELLHGEKEVVTFEQALVSYGSSGGSPRYLTPLAERWARKKLKTITQNELDAAAREIYPAATPETRNRQCYTPFIAVWNHAVKNGWAEIRQWQRPRKAKGTNVRRLTVRSGTRPVAYDRAAMFVANMSPAPAMLMTALFYTGMRPIEMFALSADDVMIKERWIVLDSSKTGEPRGVPMHEFLVPMFTALVARGGIVFRTHKGGPYPILEDGGGQMKGAITGARKRLGKDGTPIRDISPYTARHTVSTQLVINGVHPHIKDQILGHAADDMSRRYTNVPQAPLIDAINTLPVPDAWPRWDDPIAASREFVKWGKNGRRDIAIQAL